jgi:hypothetical protein
MIIHNSLLIIMSLTDIQINVDVLYVVAKV